MQTNMNKTVIYKEDAIALLDNLENYIMELEGWQEKCDGVSQAKDLIADMPEIEAEPVRHGQWIPTRPYMHSTKCTVCGNIWDLETPRCPSCGAKMDLEEPINE